MVFACRGISGPAAESKPSNVSSPFQLFTLQTSLYSICRLVLRVECSLKHGIDSWLNSHAKVSAHIGDGL